MGNIEETIKALVRAEVAVQLHSALGGALRQLQQDGTPRVMPMARKATPTPRVAEPVGNGAAKPRRKRATKAEMAERRAAKAADKSEDVF